MSFVSRFLVLCTVIALSACSGEDGGKDKDKQKAETKPPTPIAGNAPAQRKAPLGSGFDFYVLSLSWSPTWCAENDAQGRSQQCARTANHGLIVHGLWPQNEKGYPEYCNTREPDRVPDSLGRSLFDIMPSMGLIGHEWRKHGSCSGLTQKDYFATLRAARQRVSLPRELASPSAGLRKSPAEIENLLISRNPGLTAEAVAVGCANGKLDEVRICMTKDLTFRACREIDRGGCRIKTMNIPFE